MKLLKPLRMDGLMVSNHFFNARSLLRILANSGGRSMMSSPRSGVILMRARSPDPTQAPACIFLFTMRTWPRPPVPGISAVLKANPLISPKTRRLFHIGHAFLRSTGMRAITQRGEEPVVSRGARKDFESLESTVSQFRRLLSGDWKSLHSSYRPEMHTKTIDSDAFGARKGTFAAENEWPRRSILPDICFPTEARISNRQTTGGISQHLQHDANRLVCRCHQN